MPKVKLTDQFVAHAKPVGGVRTDYFDETTKGFALRVSEQGAKSWTFHFTSPRDGKRSRLTIGSYPATSLAAARTCALEAKGHVEAGQDPRIIATANVMTVEMLVDSYVAKHVKPNLRTAAEVERRFKKNIVPVIGAVKLAELHRRDASRVIDPILSRGSPLEASRAFEDLRAMLRWAVARGDLDHNPIDGMRKPAVSKPRERVLTTEEIRTLWNGLPEALSRSKTCQRIIRLCLVTAQRIGEVSGMRRDEIDFDRRLWSLPGARTKNEYPHSVPLSDLATEIIREALNEAGKVATFLFPAEDGSLPPRANMQSESLPFGRFGIAPWTAHDLRRTALTGMAELGVPPIVLGHVANHRTTTKAGMTLSVYVHHAYEREKREALELWADRLLGIVDPQPNVVSLRNG
jgi:integrase